MSEPPSCDNCHFRLAEFDTLYCLRYPPVAFRPYDRGHFPETWSGAWCGEWKPEEAEQTDP
jgi:hypothetical protein